MLNRFSCIALAGVATEYLLYGCAEGGLDDINKVRPTIFTVITYTKQHFIYPRFLTNAIKYMHIAVIGILSLDLFFS